jgi:phosphotransferase system enzyme I (PtsI)
VRILKSVVDQAHSQKIKVSVCGEMAGDAVYAPLLLGLGVDELSMSPPLIPAVKYLIRSMNLSDAQKLAADALKLNSAKEILNLCEEFSRIRVKVS